MQIVGRLLRFASITICLIVGASFFVFAIDQTKSASTHQQEELEPVTAASPGTTAGTSTSQRNTAGAVSAGGAAETQAKKPGAKKENGFHEALDETSSSLTSPFSGILSSSDSEWATRGVRLILALLVYGFGLGYIARWMRVRV